MGFAKSSTHRTYQFLGIGCLELAVQPAGEDRYRTAVGIVGRIDDELIVGGEGEIVVDRVGVVGFQNAFGAVVEPAVADQKTGTARGEEIAMGAGETVERSAKSKRIDRAPPVTSLDRDAA